LIRYLRPFTVPQTCAGVADVVKVDAGRLRQFGDAPGAFGVGEQDAQHLRGLRIEQQPEFAVIGGWFVSHAPFYEDLVEDQTGVAGEVEESNLGSAMCSMNCPG
jgi:hypothetical protein